MKLAVASDLHLEFAPFRLENPGADILILAGDTFVVENSNEALMDTVSFLWEMGEKFSHVIMIPGNHEYYHGSIGTSWDILKQRVKGLKNLHLLSDQKIDIDGIRFIGGTCWTNMNHRNPLSMLIAQESMSDFYFVLNGSKKFTPSDSVDFHDRFISFLEYTLADTPVDTRTVVISHHAPSYRSCHEMYRGSDLNHAYASSLDELIQNHPMIELWIHGHTHHHFDYMIGNTRVVCNPRGYPGEQSPKHPYQVKIVEI